MFPECKASFCGYGVATDNFNNPPIDWNGGDTYIQSKGIVRDYGVFDSPDDFYGKIGTNLKGIKQLIYQTVGRKLINRNVEKIRSTT